MKIQLSDHFTYKRLLRFTLPSVVMMLFTSIYGVVDGLFVSNVVGETAFAAINLIMPYCMIFGAIGSVFGIGGSALTALIRGRGDDEKANLVFSMVVYAIIISGIAVAVISQIFLPSVIDFFGATDSLRPYCMEYGRIFLLAQPAFLLQFGCQSLLVTAERPHLGLLFTVGAGVTNMILDWLFIAVFHWGVAGAATATCIGQCVGGIGPVFYFIFSKNCSLKLKKTRFMPRELAKAASNGLAEGITDAAMSLVSIVFNWQLLKYIGEYGVSAYGIIMYVNFVFISVYLGYSMGVAPLISYHYGTGLKDELKNLYRRSLIIITIASVVLTVTALATAKAIAGIFAGYDPEFMAISIKALILCSLSYFFSGTNIFGSNLYAALNNGKIAGVLSGLRMFVFQLIAVYLLPLIFGNDGIWLAMLAAELGVFVITLIVFRKQKERYGY